MKAHAVIALLLAGIVGSSTGPVSIAAAQSGPVCEFITDAAIDKTFGAILEAGGISDNQQMVGQGAFDAWKEYLTSPSEEKLNNTALSLTKSALSALVPGAGVSIQFSEDSIAGVKATIDEAERLRMQNFLCGGSDIFDLPNNDFWDFPLVRGMGLTCENFADQSISHSDLMKLKALWEGEHSRRVYALQGGNTLEVRNRLGQAWHLLQQKWAARWAESEYRRIRSELFRHAAGTGGRCAAAAPSQSVAALASGTWSWQCCARRPYSGTMTIGALGPGGSFTGSLSRSDGHTSRIDGHVNGSSITFTRTWDGGSQRWAGTLRDEGGRAAIHGSWSWISAPPSPEFSAGAIGADFQAAR